ncbi:hypothetical protein PMAYCL1PPCAC_27795, partial [Pristionchus mayeri]
GTFIEFTEIPKRALYRICSQLNDESFLRLRQVDMSAKIIVDGMIRNKNARIRRFAIQTRRLYIKCTFLFGRERKDLKWKLCIFKVFRKFKIDQTYPYGNKVS